MGELNAAGFCVIPAYFLFDGKSAVDKKKPLSLLVTAIHLHNIIRH